MAELSSFYASLINEEVTERNPATMWMRHSRFGTSAPVAATLGEESEIRVFSVLQLPYVRSSVHQLTSDTPERHERTLFLALLMYGCYPVKPCYSVSP
ncbi:hypothetical protein Q9290_06525 [Oceanimonas sp. CHS3-5]|uniref:hypothetical protein n=1 Tax=Oceanimonas sp. CHS3-5 TaxID=3068186 RepID=UPI00273FF6EC|nr:hypothetical protein [Oceanimonas sp. CHS3-5]MDP5291944.1 hypothetical protein [Oceanimonas sp. CHS3-5]